MCKLTSAAMWRQLTLITGVAVLVAACGSDVTTTTSPPEAAETASTPGAAASASALPAEGELTGGRYSLSDFPAAITFEIPDSDPPWFACSPSPVEQAACHEWSTGTFVAVTFQIVENVAAGCSDQETAELLDPPVGPSVDDLVTAISGLEGYEATEPVDITVDGFEGKEFTLTAVRHGCGATWSTGDRVTGMGAGEINLLRAVDFDGVRVLIAGAHDARTPDETLAAMEALMDSVEIQP